MNKKGKNKRPIRPLVLLALLFILNSLSSREFTVFNKLGLELVGAAQSVSSSIGFFFSSRVADYRELVGVREENRRLREELRQQQLSIASYREAAATNVRLKKLLDLKKSLPSPSLSVRVVGRDPSLWFKTIIVDRGSSDGVERGMPVLSYEGVVGQVISTSPSFSKVLLANDPNSAIDVIVQRNRVQGLVKGNGEGFVLHYVLRSAGVEKGDYVVTSAQGGVFPQGLAVGQVSEVVRGARGMFQGVRVEPAVDFSRLEHLVIMMHQSSLAD